MQTPKELYDEAVDILIAFEQDNRFAVYCDVFDASRLDNVIQMCNNGLETFGIAEDIKHKLLYVIASCNRHKSKFNKLQDWTRRINQLNNKTNCTSGRCSVNIMSVTYSTSTVIK